jgi:hypothetical protein
MAWTAIGRATGAHRTLLIGTCAALVVAALADEATGYDGPGPFIYPAFALLVALAPWRYTPLIATLMTVFFLYGGLVSAEFTAKLVRPDAVLDFAAGWVQMFSFAVAGVLSVASVVKARS